MFELPEGATVFARERWTGAPLTAGLQRGGAGAVSGWPRRPASAATSVFPTCSTRSAIWAWTALSRPRGSGPSSIPPTARAWTWIISPRAGGRAGIAALHVAAWHFCEADPERDAYLKRLIAACHREGILVYAWLELPHVSEKFWADHPEWREKTAILQDAQLDWRKLMNLTNRDCFRAASAGVRRRWWDASIGTA